jgi:hypothetical protein
MNTQNIALRPVVNVVKALQYPLLFEYFLVYLLPFATIIETVIKYTIFDAFT